MLKKITNLLFAQPFLFLFVGFSISVPLGLFFLTKGPIHYIAIVAEKLDWTTDYENKIQKIALFFFLCLVFCATFFLTLFLSTTPKKILKHLILFFLGGLLLSSLYLFTFRPSLLMTKNSKEVLERQTGAEFHFGSYPDEEQLIALKKQHYTIVSLLHPLVVPAEPLLINKENTIAKKVGIRIISIPMLPFIVDNDSAVVQIKQLAKTAKGNYYVHCYLGRDRANIFRHVIQSENALIRIKNALPSKSLDTITAFERGQVIHIRKNIYLTPFPTHEEFFSFILTGKIKTVVCVLTSNNKEQKKLITDEAELLKRYHIRFIEIPLEHHSSEFAVFKSTIDSLPKPMIIHSFGMDSFEIKNIRNIFKP